MNKQLQKQDVVLRKLQQSNYSLYKAYIQSELRYVPTFCIATKHYDIEYNAFYNLLIKTNVIIIANNKPQIVINNNIDDKRKYGFVHYTNVKINDIQQRGWEIYWTIEGREHIYNSLAKISIYPNIIL